jgi:hypothetical protein
LVFADDGPFSYRREYKQFAVIIIVISEKMWNVVLMA